MYDALSAGFFVVVCWAIVTACGRSAECDGHFQPHDGTITLHPTTNRTVYDTPLEGRVIPLLGPESRSLDIDSPLDWEIVEFMMGGNSNKGCINASPAKVEALVAWPQS